ncbi:MAG: hypothetical protein ABSE82_12165 [Nitrososphaerales archaeon]
MIEEKSSSRMMSRFQFLSMVGSGFLFIADYLLYLILRYVQTTYGNYVLPAWTKFALPVELTVPYFLTLAAGIGSICAADTIFRTWIRTFKQIEKNEGTFPVWYNHLLYSFGIGLYVVDLLGALSIVFLERFELLSPPEISNSLAWQLGPPAYFFGVIIILSVVPATAISILVAIFQTRNVVKLHSNAGISSFILSSFLAACSLFGLTIAFLLSLSTSSYDLIALVVTVVILLFIAGLLMLYLVGPAIERERAKHHID